MTIRIEMELDIDAYNAKYGPGSELIVTKLDRLARSTRDPLNTLATISDKAQGSEC